MKFLSSEKTETQYIINIVNKLAMVHSSIALTLQVNGKLDFDYIAHSEEKKNLLRITNMNVYGSNFAENTGYFEVSYSCVKCYGCVGLSTFHRMNANLINTFVNGRPFRDNVVNAAIRAAYNDMLSSRCCTITVLYVEMLYVKVDMNVHSIKIEVRFEDSGVIRKAAMNALKSVIGQFANHVSRGVVDNAMQCFISGDKLGSQLKDSGSSILRFQTRFKFCKAF